VSCSRCRSDGTEPGETPAGDGKTPSVPETARAPHGLPPRRPPVRGPVSIDRWLPWIILLVVIGIFWFAPPRTARRGGEPSADRRTIEWLPLGKGEVEFMGRVRSFAVSLRPGGPTYRIEEADGTASESPRLDAVCAAFLREKLIGAQVGETVRVSFFRCEERHPGRRATGAREDPPLTWAVTMGEQKQGDETWFWAKHGTTGAALHARTLADVKDKIARELAREVVMYYGMEGHS